MPDRILRVRAFAKINLSLRVLGVRADGYHDLRTILQSVALHDTLTVREAAGAFRIETDDPDCPSDRANLVWRAAGHVWRARGRRGAPRDAVVRIAKRIPVQAGLGGGSSDAAAALRALAALWRVTIDPARLRERAASLGADVPFFLDGGAALGVDRGDVLFPLAESSPAWVTIVVPPFGVSTRDAYAWDEAPGNRVSRAPSELHNDLEPPVARRYPAIARIVSALRREGASHAAMSGSGSAVFGLFADQDRAAAAALALGNRGRTFVTRTLSRARYQTLARPRFR